MFNGLLKAFQKVGLYYLGAGLFYSGLARFHLRLHEFAMRQIQRAAQAGSDKALLLMGQLLVYRGASPYNRVAGLRYLRDLINQHDAQSLSPKVYAQACFMLAEAHDRPELMVAMDTVSESGESHDRAELYLTAAKHGHIMAALRLSKAYESGTLGLAQDSMLAKKWKSTFLQASNHHEQ